MEKDKLNIHYTGELNFELDDAITGLVELYGYEFFGSGYCFVDNERDLEFHKKD